MLRDWGTALELPLYHQAIVHLLGGEAAVTHLLPMQRDGETLGNAGRMADENDLGCSLIFLLSNASVYITAVNQPVDGGYTAK
ncbi:MAG: hypothetical protein Q8M07_28440 [Prosthecobacter sp.]|nr:hypothetical protein [Prosthecobacter sp.]